MINRLKLMALKSGLIKALLFITIFFLVCSKSIASSDKPSPLCGIYTIYSREKYPHKLGKLQAMKDKFGNGAGTLIHTIAYSLIPIGAGAALIWSGHKGISISQIVGS